MHNIITESDVELAALEILENLGYEILHGPDISGDGVHPERQSYSDVVMLDRLKRAIDRINPKIPTGAKEEALKMVLRLFNQNLAENNRQFHNMVVNGVDVEYRLDDRIIDDKIWLFDFKNSENNEFLAVNQFTVIEDNNNRRPDIVLFINGLPIAVIELKNPADEDATIETARTQLETYKAQIPSLFRYNEALVISDGIEACAGTITSDKERFMAWKTIEGVEKAPDVIPQIEILLKGMFNKQVLLDLIRHFIVFEQDRIGLLKKMAGYHQYHAVNKAIEATLQATSPQGDKRCGVVWHTQGSGKSLIMAFYTGKLVLAMDNPTIVVITDRNDLDDQLFETFCRCQSLLRQTPVQAERREQLKDYLMVASGGVVFTTIQKFFPEEKGDKYPLLSDRRNIVVIADEAHRSQYD
ncbi:type I restriction endonuclease subunit R, partial [candidate division WOR-3 bacterium]|nr:type I restriction endonuclease subunit R [candidate division WOR-3 bacterium]